LRGVRGGAARERAVIFGAKRVVASRRRSEPQPAVTRGECGGDLRELRGARCRASPRRCRAARGARERPRVARNRAEIAREVQRQRVEVLADILDELRGLHRRVAHRLEQLREERAHLAA
jgi:hypothetical protein